MSFVVHEAESNASNLPGHNLTTGRSETATTTTTLMPDGYDKFASGFDPWGDYLFGSVMIFVGKILYTTLLWLDILLQQLNLLESWVFFKMILTVIMMINK